ncbi:SIS domain-containing protein [Cyanobium sp. ATX 6F1]|nr:SIS domain-containing protein [Cyanobium sp. ATX 6F1]MCP9915166.1 SIS domain-containing protein [Cyanobium sp. ATX 6F1]
MPSSEEHLYTDTLGQELSDALSVLSRLGESISVLTSIAKLILDVDEVGRTVYLCGNGGSAADAQHVAAELMGRYQLSRRPIAAVALTTDSSVLTAIANDITFEEVFARQARALVKPGDCFAAISTSGQSKNVLRALRVARNQGATTVGFTGSRGMDMVPLCDHLLMVDSTNTARIQESHILAWHMICKIIEERLIPE